MLDGSPVWPTIDGQPGHVMAFEDCYLHQVKTPCSTKSTQVEIELLQRVSSHTCSRAWQLGRLGIACCSVGQAAGGRGCVRVACQVAEVGRLVSGRRTAVVVGG